MDVATQFFLAKNITLDKILFSVLDGINRMSVKKKDLQERTNIFWPFNIDLYCRNYRLALCLSHLMKNIEYAELLLY